MLVAKNITWDIDLEDGETYEDAKKRLVLPDEMNIREGMTDEEEISDYLSDVTGFCHRGFSLEEENTKFSVVGYDKDHDVYVEYKQFHQRIVAEAYAKDLKKGIEKGTLTRKCSDGTLEPIDWVQVVDSEDFDKVFWASYDSSEESDNDNFQKNERLNQLTKQLEKEGYKVKHIQLSFPEGIKQAIRIDTDYAGLYPGMEQFQILNAIRNHVQRYYKDLTVESRGHYTAIFIYQ